LIITAILSVLIGLIRVLIFFLPNFNGLPIDQQSAVAPWVTALAKANSLVPIDTVLAVISIVFVIETSILLFRLVEWVWSKIFPTGQMRLF